MGFFERARRRIMRARLAAVVVLMALAVAALKAARQWAGWLRRTAAASAVRGRRWAAAAASTADRAARTFARSASAWARVTARTVARSVAAWARAAGRAARTVAQSGAVWARTAARTVARSVAAWARAARDAARIVARSVVAWARTAGNAARTLARSVAASARAAGEAARTLARSVAASARAAGEAARTLARSVAARARVTARSFARWVAVWAWAAAEATRRFARSVVAWARPRAAALGRGVALARRRVGGGARWAAAVLGEGAHAVWDASVRFVDWAMAVTARGGRRLALVVGVSALVGLLAAAVNLGKTPIQGGSDSANVTVAAAATHVLVDYPDRSIVERKTLPQHLPTLIKRAELYGRATVSPAVLEYVARRTGVPADQLAGVARTTTSVPRPLTEPGSEQRASEIAGTKLPYRIEVQARPTSPIIDIYTQAPSARMAARLADAAVAGLHDYLEQRASQQRVPASQLIALRQLGSARGAVVNAKAPFVTGFLTFVVFFGITAIAMVAVIALHTKRRGGRPWPRPASASPIRPARRLRIDARGRLLEVADDWPRTGRVLPWMLAAFITMLWTVPFNSIQLNATLPIDLKLDRLVLPFIFAVWVLAIAVGGRGRPRFRWSGIQLAILAFLAFAFVSVVANAGYLNQTLEYELALKKLPLLLSYISVFVIVSTAVRPGEVAAFLKLTLALAVVCGLGIVYEYRFHENVFTLLWGNVLPGVFRVDAAIGGEVDSLGRPAVLGPAEMGLETVSIVAMALPVALVLLLQSRRWRTRLLYAIAACVLVAAAFATLRKSALLAPVSVVLTLAYFRRRELLKLAPLGMVVIVMVSAVSPGALGSTVSQFTRADRASVATVSDRTADYDAVRPDMWTHLLFGRGWGSYNHETYRVLDSEILHRLMEMGVLGLLAFVAMCVSVVVAARHTIAGRDRRWAPSALIGAAAAASFLVGAMLYDILSFPHATYVFLYLAGLVAVVIDRGEETPPVTARRALAPRRSHGARGRGGEPPPGRVPARAR